MSIRTITKVFLIIGKKREVLEQLKYASVADLEAS